MSDRVLASPLAGGHNRIISTVCFLSRGLAMVARLGRELVRGVRQLLYPAVCTACGIPIADGTGVFCLPCREALTADPHRTCPLCASPVGEFAYLDDGCIRCRDEKYAFDGAFRLGPYDGALREANL